MGLAHFDGFEVGLGVAKGLDQSSCARGLVKSAK